MPKSAIAIAETGDRDARFERSPSAETGDRDQPKSAVNDVGAGTSMLAGEVTSTRGGAVQLEADGDFVYFPPGGSTFWGDDYFRYSITADERTFSEATVRVSVQPTSIALEDLERGDGNGVAFLGTETTSTGGGERAGTSVDGAGDINGDGLADVIVGAPFRTELGGAVVLLGAPDPVGGTLTGLVEAGGALELSGEGTPQSRYGTSVAGAGDLDGDGLDDLLITPGGTSQGGTGSSGPAYAVFSGGIQSRTSLGTFDGVSPGGFSLSSQSSGDQAMVSVSRIGDLNRDGSNDFVIGITHGGAVGSNAASGRACVVLGKGTAEPVLLDGEDGCGNRGFEIATLRHGEGSVAGAGDVNGDGLGDIVVGDNTRQHGEGDELIGSGVAFVVLGQAGLTPIDLDDVQDGIDRNGFAVLGALDDDRTGHSVAGAGDVNGDGLDDVIIGSGLAGTNGRETPGKAYVVFGKRDSEPVSLAAVEAGGSSQGFLIEGVAVADRLGEGLIVAGAGDINHDGRADVVVHPGNGFGPDDRLYLIFGKADGAPISLASIEAGDPAGLLIVGAPGDDGGASVAPAGDFNGDGISDLVIGRPGADSAEANNTGRAYVLFGWDTTGALGPRRRSLKGTSENDTLLFDGPPLISVDAGHGFDVLQVAGSGLTVDATPAGVELRSVERIDLRGSGPNRLVLSDSAVRRIPEARPDAPGGLVRTLTVIGDADDTLDFDFDGYEPAGSNAGLLVFRRTGGLYGIEVSAALVPSTTVENFSM